MGTNDLRRVITLQFKIFRDMNLNFAPPKDSTSQADALSGFETFLIDERGLVDQDCTRLVKAANRWRSRENRWPTPFDWFSAMDPLKLKRISNDQCTEEDRARNVAALIDIRGYIERGEQLDEVEFFKKWGIDAVPLEPRTSTKQPFVRRRV